MAAPYTTRIPKKFIKTITFDGSSGLGLSTTTVPVATVTGSVLFKDLSARCLVDLGGASATVEMGCPLDTAGLLPQIVGTTLDVLEFWETTPSSVAASVVDKTVVGNIAITVGTANVTSGSIEIVGYWLPISADGNLA